MRTSLLQILCTAAITLSLSNGDPDCNSNPNANQCRTATQDTNSKTQTTSTDRSTSAVGNRSAENKTEVTTIKNDAASPSSSTSQGTPISDSQTGSNTTVIVAASVGTCVAVIFFVLLVLIRRRHILRNCILPHKKPDEKKLTRFNMYPDIEEGTSDDNKYAEIPLDNLDSIKNEDNVYQTIDPLQEQETVIDDKYSHINGNALPLTNTSYSHIAGDFQRKRLDSDYKEIAKLEGIPKGDLKLKTNESNTSYDIIGKTKFGVTANPQVMESTYNHIHSETNQNGTSTSDVNNYSHLHVLSKSTQINETMTNNWYNKHNKPVIDNPNLVHKEDGFYLKEGDTEPKSIDKTEEKDTAAVVKLPVTSIFSLTENCEENAVDHQYFVLEKVDKTEEKEPPAVVKLPVTNIISLTENCEENAVDHQYFVLEKVDKTEEKEPPVVV